MPVKPPARRRAIEIGAARRASATPSECAAFAGNELYLNGLYSGMTSSQFAFSKYGTTPRQADPPREPAPQASLRSSATARISFAGRGAPFTLHGVERVLQDQRTAVRVADEDEGRIRGWCP